jgi:hypothetical protein
MAWNLATRLRRLGGAEEPTHADHDDDPFAFPAGVVAVGRGGAGATGALLREDGMYIGLLRLVGSWQGGRTRDDVAALALALPPIACQIVTVRWPVNAERATLGWQAMGTRRGLPSPWRCRTPIYQP